MPNSRAPARRFRPSTSTARRTRPYISTWNIPPVSHKPPLPGNGSRNKDPAVDYFYSAAKHRSRGVLWSIFAPALIDVSPLSLSLGYTAAFGASGRQRGNGGPLSLRVPESTCEEVGWYPQWLH